MTRSPNGPRILFKDGPRGAFLFAGHFADPAICLMLSAAAETAPALRGDVMVVTEGYRPERSGKPSLHPKLKALDIRTGIDDPTLPGAVIGEGRTQRLAIADAWAARIHARLGRDFDVVFGDPGHVNHIHSEHDPRG